MVLALATTVITSLGARMTTASVAASRAAGGGFGLHDVTTCVLFAAVSMAMQGGEAGGRSDEEATGAGVLVVRAGARRRRLAGWLFLTWYFVCYVSYGGGVAPTSLEWAVAGVASAANLAVTVRTVLIHPYKV
uniref:Uncharacterized protein n=1 Tax=Leersia perrieri TaxID=77586 RepID=A0A0D9X116_9ORYZ